MNNPMNTSLLIKKAKELSDKVHKNHIRQSGDAYSDHTSRVYSLLCQIGITDEVTLSSSFLHHVLDKDPKLEIEIKNTYGDEVYKTIIDYKKLSEDSFSDLDHINIDESLIIQTYLNIAQNPKTLLIRLADKTDNIQSAHKMDPQQSLKVAQKALNIYSPICKLLGIGKFYKILDDEAFKIINPKEYFRISSYIKSHFPLITKHIEESKRFLTETLNESGIHPFIEARVKGVFSTYKKLNQYLERGIISKDSDLKRLFDIGAMRIIVDTEEEAYFVEDLLNNLWNNVPGERDDYITNPKPNGYMSLQNSYYLSTTTIVEVQIRTHQMHENNEYGLASHAVYKIQKQLAKDPMQNQILLKEINYTLNRENINIKHFSNFVYVYTPKGEIVKLPRGSSLIDFAYSIHKDLGNSCVGGSINGEYKPLTSELKDGDRVEIKTQKGKQKPSADWLNIVKTKRARTEIKKALNK
jgi:GTP diphosphokinase / guanosine-3',5'-bis(diphosphate) 3'-diphosphatase